MQKCTLLPVIAICTPLDVECSFCNARHGEACITRNGKSMIGYHAQRVDYYNLMKHVGGIVLP